MMDDIEDDSRTQATEPLEEDEDGQNLAKFLKLVPEFHAKLARNVLDNET